MLPGVDYIHIIFTRFNVPSGGREQQIRLSEGWLEHRFELFEQYCLPSVYSQTQKDFVWVVFFDENTPDCYKEKIEGYSRSFEQFTPYFVSSWDTKIIKERLSSILSIYDYVLMTRLDNDDAINRHFCERLYEQQFRDGVYYNFTRGLTFKNGVAYEHFDRSNAFLSLFEATDGYNGVWKYQHPDVIRKFEVVQIYLPYSWLQVVHGRNVSNRVRGRIEPGSRWVTEYPSTIGCVRDINTLHVIKNNYFDYYIVRIRDYIVRIFKRG